MNAKRYCYLSAACAAALALAAGCGKKSPEPRLKPIPKDSVILVYAAGVGGDEVDIFRSAPMEETLAKEMKGKVVCMGQPGEYAESALKCLPAVLKGCDPDLMILGYGAMDLWKMTDRAKLKANLIAMIDLAHQQDTQVVMLALPDINKVRVKIDPIFEEVAKEKGVPIEAEIVRTVLKTPSERVFRYIVNDKGLEAMAKAVRALCVRCGGMQD